jgi:hypothetical protein
VGNCTIKLEADTTVSATFEIAPNVAFLSSATSTGDFGGLPYPDTQCQALAEGAGLVGTGAGQNAIFKSWLSTPSESAASRIGVASGWVRPDGKPFANTVGDIVNNLTFYPLRLSEKGADIGGGKYVWTGTGADALYRAPDCKPVGSTSPWSDKTVSVFGAMGRADDSSTYFSWYGTVSCLAPNHFYCFGVDRDAVVTPAPVNGRLAFTSEATFFPGAGIEDADEICNLEASANDLPGTYLALLATTSSSAISRFDLSGPTWVRVGDRLPLAPTASAFADPNTVNNDVAPVVTASGARTGPRGIWTGSTSLSTVGTAATTCANWTAQTNSHTAVFGLSSATYRQLWLSHQSLGTCASHFKVTCLQE